MMSLECFRVLDDAGGGGYMMSLGGLWIRVLNDIGVSMSLGGLCFRVLKQCWGYI